MILTLTRTDGTQTWSPIRPGLEMHDLAHYAAEEILGWQEGFFGLVNLGYTTEDFELPRDQRPEPLLPKNLPVQSIQGEHLVNLLQVDYLNAGFGEPFTTMFRRVLEEKDLPYPDEVTEERVIEIKTRLQELMYQYSTLEEGQSLELIFSPVVRK